jgi:uncharacterized iron-regulated membrane protein
VRTLSQSFNPAVATSQRQPWLNYRTVWRWHFYAGLFCIPFVIWLSVTGSIYLFKPQIERWLDRPYDQLTIDGPRATAQMQVLAALAAVPGSSLHYFELPSSEHSATRIIVGRNAGEFRVYVHPQSLRVLKVINEDDRPMKIVFRLHGELLVGDRGSIVVELAASWAIVMILTGVYLWWPRGTERLAGVIFIRMRRGQRILWRDLHAVTGIWISAFALFLLLTGLPWAKSWSSYLKIARTFGGRASIRQDWTTGRSSEVAERMAMNHDSMEGMSMDHAGHHGNGTIMNVTPESYAQLDKIVAAAVPLQLAYPVLISPPTHSGQAWKVKSDAQNRPLRTSLSLDPKTGGILKREEFRQRKLLDRMIGIGVAAHEGQLFGLINQLIGLFTATGLVMISVSGAVLWWRRRAVGVLGAPIPLRKPRFTAGLAALILVLGLYLPLFGVSFLSVVVFEKTALRRFPGAERWLGLRTANSEVDQFS